VIETYTVIVRRQLNSDGFTFTNPQQALRALSILSECMPDVSLSIYVGGSQVALDVVGARWTAVIPKSASRAA
jgi:hypothetical protein